MTRTAWEEQPKRACGEDGGIPPQKNGRDGKSCKTRHALKWQLDDNKALARHLFQKNLTITI